MFCLLTAEEWPYPTSFFIFFVILFSRRHNSLKNNILKLKNIFVKPSFSLFDTFKFVFLAT